VLFHLVSKRISLPAAHKHLFLVVGRRPQGTLQGYFASAGSLARILFPIMSGYIITLDSINTVMVVLFVNLIIANCFVAMNSRTLEALAV
jgi:hypothetical protein